MPTGPASNLSFHSRFFRLDEVIEQAGKPDDHEKVKEKPNSHQSAIIV